MTVEEAIALMRARWAHPPLERRYVEERLAVRLEAGPTREVVVAEMPPACRIFVRHAKGWRSRYVHELADVDSVLDWILSRCV